MNFRSRFKSRWPEIRWVLSRLTVLLFDVSAVSIGYAAAYTVRFFFSPFLHLFPITKGLPLFSVYEQAWPVIAAAWLIALLNLDAYKRLHYAAVDEVIRLFKASVVGSLLAMSAMFLYRENSYSRLVFLLGGGFSFLLLFAFREAQKFIYLLWVRSRRRPRRVLIVGSGYLSKSLQRILQREGDRAVLRLNFFDRGVIRRTIQRSRIKEVLIANPKINHKDAVALAEYCEEKGIRFRLIPDILEIRMGEVIIDESLGIPTFQLKPLSLHGTSFLVKRAFDIILSSLFLGIFFLPMVFIAFLIKSTTAGPVFYRQERLGFRSRNFQFMKFRTMVKNADDLLESLKKLSDRGGPVFKMKADPRVTPVGQILRRYSLDELPQLLNVLKGDMSLVGPRPQVIWETAGYDEWARKRLNVLPGITGLWQVSGRAELTFEEMIDLDIFYIEHWSPGLDLKVLLKTLPAVVSGRGAY